MRYLFYKLRAEYYQNAYEDLKSELGRIQNLQPEIILTTDPMTGLRSSREMIDYKELRTK